MKVLITGHTGFKGSWLSFMLASRGYELHGLSLEPREGSLYSRANVSGLYSSETFADISDFETVKRVFNSARPDFVIHMAAQPLVSISYLDPFETYKSNVLGTLNLLQAAEVANGLEGMLVITTDKVYKNDHVGHQSFLETDTLGNTSDPYSNSKTLADLMTQTWASRNKGPKTLICRAGNVIGGGDDSKDRLMPDLMSYWLEEKPITIRNKNATRPWQHVLDCLEGYIQLIENFKQVPNGSAWNFGPPSNSIRTVEDVMKFTSTYANFELGGIQIGGPTFAETETLSLDSSKSRESLGWREKLSFTDSIAWTVDWHRMVFDGADAHTITMNQISKYLDLA